METKHLRVAISTAWLVALIVAVAFILSSCAGFKNLPSVCDDLEGSALCDTADNAGVRLEDIGNAFIIANAISIGQGIYTKEQARVVLNELQDALMNPITWVLFSDIVKGKIEQYPGLLEIAEGYFTVLVDSYAQIYDADRTILVGWLGKQIKILS